MVLEWTTNNNQKRKNNYYELTCNTEHFKSTKIF